MILAWTNTISCVQRYKRHRPSSRLFTSYVLSFLYRIFCVYGWCAGLLLKLLPEQMLTQKGVLSDADN